MVSPSNKRTPPKYPSSASPRAQDSSAPEWRTATDPVSGKPYYYEKGTKKTQWPKPDELQTPADRAEVVASLNAKIAKCDKTIAERDNEITALKAKITQQRRFAATSKSPPKSPTISPVSRPSSPFRTPMSTTSSYNDHDTTVEIISPLPTKTTNPSQTKQLKRQYETLSTATALFGAFILTTILALFASISDDLDVMNNLRVKQVFFLWCWVFITFTIQDLIVKKAIQELKDGDAYNSSDAHLLHPNISNISNASDSTTLSPPKRLTIKPTNVSFDRPNSPSELKLERKKLQLENDLSVLKGHKIKIATLEQELSSLSEKIKRKKEDTDNVWF